MSRDPALRPEEPDDGPTGPSGPAGPSSGSLRPTPPAVLAAWAVVGLVVGWLVRPVAERLDGTAPIITWVQPAGLLAVAGVLGVAAHATWRSVQVRRELLLPHQAVNRLVLARASAYVGSLAAGGYLGYALTWLGVEADLAEQRLGRSLVAAVAGVLVAVAALLLERACRVRDGGDEGGGTRA